MLLQVNAYSDVDPRKLMDLYAEGNLENAEYFYPDLDRVTGMKKVEDDFLAWLRTDFMKKPENTYWVLEENGVWVSALRLTELEGRLFYLEALETHPDHRRRGYAAKLLNEVAEALKKQGPFRICDCVSKRNTASIRTHERAGFRIVSEEGYDYLQKETYEKDYGFELISAGEE